jgi:hypothetical protein
MCTVMDSLRDHAILVRLLVDIFGKKNPSLRKQGPAAGPGIGIGPVGYALLANSIVSLASIPIFSETSANSLASANVTYL